MRVAFIVIALLLASCSGPDPQESRIKGQWRMAGAGTTSNMVNMTLGQEENTISGFADVNSMVYDLDGRWEGSQEPEEVFQMDISVTVGQTALKGTGTVLLGGEERDVTVVGNRTGRSFRFTLNPENGDTLGVSGLIDYNLKDFSLTVEVENLPAGLGGGESRTLQLTVSGTSRGGGLDLFQ